MNNTAPQDAAVPVSEVPHREFDFEAWMEANTYSRDSAPNDCYYVKESAVRELWDRQQRAPQSKCRTCGAQMDRRCNICVRQNNFDAAEQTHTPAMGEGATDEYCGDDRNGKGEIW